MVVRIQLSVIGLYLPPVFVRLKDSSTPPQTIISLPVQTAVRGLRPSGTFVSPVEVQLSFLGSYLPPVCKACILSLPPQMIISLPVHTAVCPNRAMGAFTMLVAVQLSLVGLYRPPSFKMQLPSQPRPPQTIISL